MSALLLMICGKEKKPLLIYTYIGHSTCDLFIRMVIFQSLKLSLNYCSAILSIAFHLLGRLSFSFFVNLFFSCSVDCFPSLSNFFQYSPENINAGKVAPPNIVVKEFWHIDSYKISNYNLLEKNINICGKYLHCSTIYSKFFL